MTPSALLSEAIGRIPALAEAAVSDLDDDALGWRPGGDGNSIAWLVWHVGRVQDDHVADAFGTEQAWTAAGFAESFGLDLAVGDIGYGHSGEQVAAVTGVSAEELARYVAAVVSQTQAGLAEVADGELDRIVDDSWDPPVTLGARLVSVLSDNLQHLGQAAYLRGMLGSD